MNKNFLLLTYLPDIPHIPEFDNKDDIFSWVIYHMKDINLLLNAYLTGNLFIHVDALSNYFLEMRNILVNQLRQEIDGTISDDNNELLRKEYKEMNVLLTRIKQEHREHREQCD